MKRNEVKKTNSKKVNQVEVDFYKRYLVYNEFQKIIEDILFFELEEEHYEFVKEAISFEMIADFSDYGDGIIDLDFIDYCEGDKCFLCFIKFDLDEFIEFIIHCYLE